MLFNSLDYFFFLIITVVVFYILKGKQRIVFLFLANSYFYISVKFEYIFLILALTVLNYYFNIYIEKAGTKKQKKTFLTAIVTINVLVLAFFKYTAFLIENLFYIIKTPQPVNIFTEIILPIGLSFYIFQFIGYNLDIFRGTQKAERNFFDFSLFIMFFPKLLVGPIERGKNFLGQIHSHIVYDNNNIIEGLKLITWGLFKKLVIADRIALYTNAVYSNYEYHSGITLVVTVFLYAIQLYTDFSGYTDIALGSARLFSFKLLPNFNRPFLASNVSELWRRWHMSLSTWVNEYIYKPTVLKRRDWGNNGVLYALFITFLTVGIWHGATWNFIIFGVIQSLALIFETVTKSRRKKLAKMIPAFIYETSSIIFTFVFFSISLIFFRMSTLTEASGLIGRIIEFPAGTIFVDAPSTLIFILFGSLFIMIYEIIVEFNFIKISLFENNNWFVQQLSYAVLIILILLIGVFDGGQFIYFQF